MKENPDCLYVEEVESLVRSLRRIKKYNLDSKPKCGFPSQPHQIIEKECNRWIGILTLAVGKRRELVEPKFLKLRRKAVMRE